MRDKTEKILEKFSQEVMLSVKIVSHPTKPKLPKFAALPFKRKNGKPFPIFILGESPIQCLCDGGVVLHEAKEKANEELIKQVCKISVKHQIALVDGIFETPHSSSQEENANLMIHFLLEVFSLID